MTRTFKTLSALLVCALLVVTLASCSAEKRYEKVAEKIRVAEAKEEALEYAAVEKLLGDPTSDLTASFGSSGKTGLVSWYAGCKTMDEVNEKLEAGKSVPYIVVTFAGGKATNATVSVAEPSEDK